MQATTQLPDTARQRFIRREDSDVVILYDYWDLTFQRWIYELTLHGDGSWTLMRGLWKD